MRSPQASRLSSDRPPLCGSAEAGPSNQFHSCAGRRCTAICPPFAPWPR
jgi:hypothetical protein